jgi:hypothetical protein
MRRAVLTLAVVVAESGSLGSGGGAIVPRSPRFGSPRVVTGCGN